MRRQRHIPKAIRRPRSLLAIPAVPGGFLDNPPSDCSKSHPFNPDPERYETIMIVDYSCCNISCSAKVSSICPRKVEQDQGARRRISRQRNGE